MLSVGPSTGFGSFMRRPFSACGGQRKRAARGRSSTRRDHKLKAGYRRRETENHPGHNRLAREKVRDLAAYRFRNHLNLDPPLELVAALILIARARQRTTNLGNVVPARVVAMAAGTAADAGLPHDQQEIRHRLPRKPLSLKA